MSADDLAVRLIDVAARRVVRVFRGHTNRVTDICPSPDGRSAPAPPAPPSAGAAVCGGVRRCAAGVSWGGG